MVDLKMVTDNTIRKEVTSFYSVGGAWSEGLQQISVVLLQNPRLKLP